MARVTTAVIEAVRERGSMTETEIEGCKGMMLEILRKLEVDVRLRLASAWMWKKQVNETSQPCATSQALG